VGGFRAEFALVRLKHRRNGHQRSGRTPTETSRSVRVRALRQCSYSTRYCSPERLDGRRVRCLLGHRMPNIGKTVQYYPLQYAKTQEYRGLSHRGRRDRKVVSRLCGLVSSLHRPVRRRSDSAGRSASWSPHTSLSSAAFAQLRARAESSSAGFVPSSARTSGLTARFAPLSGRFVRSSAGFASLLAHTCSL
jgi:hypothetical protein